MDKDAEIARLVACNDELEDKLTEARASIKVLQAYKEEADKLIAAIQKAMNDYEYSV